MDMAKILIIDDERAIRRALREILEFEDFEVEEAENGKEGLEKAQAIAYDIIFCDIKMPLMDGMEVLDALQKAKVESPVIMISGHGNIDTAVQAIKKGPRGRDQAAQDNSKTIQRQFNHRGDSGAQSYQRDDRKSGPI